MNKTLPRLLLVSEVFLGAKGTGIDRTLFNLFESYPPDLFMLYTTDECIKYNQTDDIFNKNIEVYPRTILPRIKNRFGVFFNPILTNLDLQLVDLLPLPRYQQIIDFAPEVIIICPVSSMGLAIGYKVIQTLQSNFLIYFMDDWVRLDHSRWLTGSVQAICDYLLQKSSGWLMISTQLEKELTERYKTKPKRSLIVHNPVDLSNKIFPEPKSNLRETFRIVYAGSIWPMHYDAVATIAESIYELRKDGVDIELVLYTPLNFWSFYEKNWKKWEVIYGYLIPYNELNQYLQKADLLLVASSFLPENSSMTNSSVQTKLTDYMASGRPILACGPTDSACNQFVKTWNCGLVCETDEIEVVKQFLLKQVENTTELESLARNAFDVVSNHFEASKVTSNLYKFIQQISIIR
jgi:glycosyltransferase involved in cell wall biosynthesis